MRNQYSPSLTVRRSHTSLNQTLSASTESIYSSACLSSRARGLPPDPSYSILGCSFCVLEGTCFQHWCQPYSYMVPFSSALGMPTNTAPPSGQDLRLQVANGHPLALLDSARSSVPKSSFPEQIFATLPTFWSSLPSQTSPTKHRRAPTHK